MSNKNWEDRMREGFESQSFKAPTDLFGKLFDEPFLPEDQERILAAFEEEQFSAPNESWETVRHSLIVNTTWKNIQNELDKDNRKPIWWWFAGASALVVFGVLAWWWPHQLKVTIPNSYESTEESSWNEQQVADYNEKQTLVQPNGETIVNQNIQPNAGKTITFLSTQTNQSSAPNVVADVDDLHLDEAIPSGNSEENEELSLEPKDWSFVNKDLVLPRFKMEKKTWWFGFDASIGNSMIFNNEVRSGFKRTSLVSNHFSVGYQLGATVKWAKNAWNVNAGIYPYINYSQRFDCYENGVYEHEKLSLTGQSLAISVGRQKGLNLACTKWVTWDVGMYASHLKWKLDEPLTEVWKENMTDFGTIAAIGFRNQSRSLPIEIGGRSMIGLNNLQKDKSAIGKFDPISVGYLGVYTKIYF